MDKSLFFHSPAIFEKPNLNDSIRQKYINLHSSQIEEEISDFQFRNEKETNESQKYSIEEEVREFLCMVLNILETDISFQLFDELLQTTSICFSHHPNYSLPFLEQFLQKSKFNEYYIIIMSTILFELKVNQCKSFNTTCRYFIESCLNEIQPQIQNKKENLTLFGLQISPQFKNVFILNVVFSSDMTEQISSIFFPYLLSQNLFLRNEKFFLFLQELLKNGLIEISFEKEETRNELFNIIKNKNIQHVSSMNSETLSFVACVIFFIRKEGKCEVKNLTSKTVIPFYAVILTYLQQEQSEIQFSTPEIANLIPKGIELIYDQNSPLFEESLNLILNSIEFLFIRELITAEINLNIILILSNKLIKNELSNLKGTIISLLFDLSSLINCEPIVNFFNTNGRKLFDLFYSNYLEIEKLKSHKLNLGIFRPKDIFIHMNNLKETSEVIRTLHFFEDFCYNEPLIPSFKEISICLLQSIHEKIAKKNWSEVLLIGDFMKRNDFIFDLLELKSELFPEFVRYELFEFVPTEETEIETLISCILVDPCIEKNNQIFQLLFNKLIKDKEILQYYLEHLICLHSYNCNYTTTILKKLLVEYDNYQDFFIDVINQNFFFDKNINILFKRKNYIPHFSSVSGLGSLVLSKLFKEVEEKPLNYQVFVCLKNVASSFPFLFENDPQQVFNAVLHPLDYFSLIFEKDKVKTHFNLIKISISAISFLSSTLQSPFVFDNFFKWLFENISTFTNSQVFSFILLLLVFKDSSISIIIQTWIFKYDFIETVGKLLERDIKEGFFKSQYINTLCRFISETYIIMLKLSRYDIIQIDELMKFEYPLTYFYENISLSQPCTTNLFSINLKRISKEIGQFKSDIDCSKEFWLSFDFIHKRNKLPNPNQINYFIEKMKNDETRAKNIENLPKFQDAFTMKMIRYLVMKPSYIYAWFLYGQVTTLIPEFPQMVNETLIDLNKMKKEALENLDLKENADFGLFKTSEYLIPQLKYLVDFLTSPKISSHFTSLFSRVFKKISKKALSFPIFLNFTFQSFKEISARSCETTNSLFSMHHTIDLFKILASIKIYKKAINNFFIGNLFDVAFSPRWRKNTDFLLKVLQLMFPLNSDCSFYITQIIGLILINKPEELFSIISIYEKLKYEQKRKLDDIILSNFDNEVKKGKITEQIINYHKYFSTLIGKRTKALTSLLRENVRYFTDKNNINKESLNFLAGIFNMLAPKRFTTSNNDFKKSSSTISKQIREQFPIFWDLYEKYRKVIIKIISEKPGKLGKFKFLLDYPELADLSIRSSFFRRKMKKRIVMNQIAFEIDRDDILESSFRMIHNIDPTELMNQITIQYKKEIGLDSGGLLRDWFTQLSKAIFNPNCVLFSCSEKNKSYHPNSQSSINSNHLQYFKFAGLIVARALIEGVCIDAHLATSFCKQILHSEPNLSDLEDVDSELYHSLQSLLDSDVDSLCLTFTSSDNDFGVCKTVPLKENGEEIDVINENKNEYINLLANYKLKVSIEEQVKAFSVGFDSLISNHDIKIFTPNELDLLICGMPTIDVKDFRNHTEFVHPYTAETPVVKFFFNVISKWDNERLAKLLLFMTGSSRVPSNGFQGFCEMSGQSMKIAPGGNKCLLPVARTCFNRIDLPQYETEDELNEKLSLAIKNCDSFEIR